MILAAKQINHATKTIFHKNVETDTELGWRTQRKGVVYNHVEQRPQSQINYDQ